MSKDEKLVIVGAGPAGYAAAFKAADLGLSVTLIDPEANPGGVCLHRGCIPSKALLYLVKIKHEAKAAKTFGLNFAEPKVSIENVRNWKNSVIKKLTSGLGQLAKQRKVNYIQGKATVIDQGKLEITHNNGKKSEENFDKLILATGSTPAELPNITIDHEFILDSTDALELQKIPKELLVIGGGYIGLELGSVFAGFGSSVTIAEMTKGFLPGADPELVQVYEKANKDLFKERLFETKVLDLLVKNRKVHVTFERDGKKEERKFDQVLLAAGRKPNTKGLNLEKVGVNVDEKGFIPVNLQRQTNKDNIYAIGDLTGEPMLAHKGNREGIAVAEYLAGNQGAAYDPVAIPAVVFTEPEIAWCGLTEMEAKKTGVAYKVARFPWAASGRAASMGTSIGLTKIIADPKTGNILGAGVAGKDAGSLIPELVLAIEMGTNMEDLALTIHPHPTLSETIMESAESFLGSATHYVG